MANDIVTIRKMLKYCDDATKYVSDIEYDEFIGNELYLTFSVFALTQLGELASRLSNDFCVRYPSIPWRAIRGVRNRIIHDYEGIKFSVLWDVLKVNISTLKQQLEQIIDELHDSCEG